MAKFFFFSLPHFLKGAASSPLNVCLNVRDSWVEKHVFIIVLCILFPSKSLLYVIIMQWKCSRTSGSHWGSKQSEALSQWSARPWPRRYLAPLLWPIDVFLPHFLLLLHLSHAEEEEDCTGTFKKRKTGPREEGGCQKRWPVRPTNCSPAVSASTSNIQPVTRLLHIKTYKWLVNHMHTKNTSVVFQNIVSLHLEREIGSQTLSAVFSKLWIITHKSYLLRYFRSDFDETLEETQWMGVEDFCICRFLIYDFFFFFNEYFKSRLVKTHKFFFLIN